MKHSTMNTVDTQFHRLRFGVLLSSHELKKWHCLVLQDLLKLDTVELVVFVVDGTPPQNRFIEKLTNRTFLNSCLFSIYKNIPRVPFTEKKVPLQHIYPNIPILYSIPIQLNRFTQKFHEDDIQKIEEYKLDFLLRFGFGILKGKILSTPRFGIWSYHHDDEQVIRGGQRVFGKCTTIIR